MTAESVFPSLAVDTADPAEMAEKLHTRLTYEGPIIFVAKRPLNPRGRTGLRGRGLLPRWGPNQVAEPVITRLHPHTNELQLVVIRDSKGQWAVPRCEVEGSSELPADFKQKLSEEVASDSRERAERLSQLLEELLDGAGHPIYCGYRDDPANTDNAWYESRAFHWHCSRELGGILSFSHKHGDQRLAWRNASEPNIAAPWRDLIKERWTELQKPGLLQLVVRWGRNDIAQIVLNDPELHEQRLPAQARDALTTKSGPF
jgi:ADP-ribose pyrophosphatase